MPIIAKRGEGVFWTDSRDGRRRRHRQRHQQRQRHARAQSQRSDGNGNRIIDVMLEQIDAAMADNISRGNGKTPAALESRYGLNRAAGAC